MPTTSPATPVPYADATRVAAACALGASITAPTPTRTSAATDPICHPRGQVNHARAYHGRRAHSCTAAMTRGSSVCGACGMGSCCRFLPTTIASVSGSAGCMVGQQFSQGLAAPMDIDFHFGQRHAKSVGDVLVARFFKMEEHERHALVIGKAAERLLQPLAPIGIVHVRRTLNRRLEFFAGGGLELAEEPPACAVPREVIEAGVPRDRLQPSGYGRARRDRVEALKGP